MVLVCRGYKALFFGTTLIKIRLKNKVTTGLLNFMIQIGQVIQIDFLLIRLTI